MLDLGRRLVLADGQHGEGVGNGDGDQASEEADLGAAQLADVGQAANVLVGQLHDGVARGRGLGVVRQLGLEDQVLHADGRGVAADRAVVAGRALNVERRRIAGVKLVEEDKGGGGQDGCKEEVAESASRSGVSFFSSAPSRPTAPTFLAGALRTTYNA